MSFVPLVRIWVWLSVLASVAGWVLSAVGQLNRLGYAVFALVVGIGVWLWQPWLAPWQKSAADYLAGSWCRPMGGTALARFDFVRAGRDEVRGEVHFSHSTDVFRSKAKTEATADRIILHWTEPEERVKGGPTSYKIVDDVSIEALPEDPKEAEAPDYEKAVWTRCPASSGG